MALHLHALRSSDYRTVVDSLLAEALGLFDFWTLCEGFQVAAGRNSSERLCSQLS